MSKCTERPRTERKESDMHSTLHMLFTGPRFPDFHSIHFTISRFQDIAHFRISPLTPKLKFQTAIFLKLDHCQER